MSDGTDTDKPDTQAQSEPDIIDVEVVKEELPPEPSAPKQVPEQKSSKAGWITAALLSAFIGGVYTAPYFKDGLVLLGIQPAAVTPPSLSEPVDLSPLRSSMSDLEAQLARHREILSQHEDQISSNAQSLMGIGTAATETATTAAPEIASSEMVNLKETVDRLSNDIARLANLSNSDNPAVAQLTGSIALLKAESEQVQNRFSALEAAIADLQAGSIDASPRGRLMLSLSRIKERALKGFAFDSDITALRPDIAALTALDQQLIGAELAILQDASSGITTYENLSEGFDQMAASALQSAQKEEGGFLSNLFTVRRTDAGATGNDAIFLEAEKKLALRNIPGAIETLESLSGAALQATQNWRDQAATLARVETAFDRMTTAITNAKVRDGERG